VWDESDFASNDWWLQFLLHSSVGVRISLQNLHKRKGEREREKPLVKILSAGRGSAEHMEGHGLWTWESMVRCGGREMTDFPQSSPSPFPFLKMKLCWERRAGFDLYPSPRALLSPNVNPIRILLRRKQMTTQDGTEVGNCRRRRKQIPNHA